MGTSTQFSCTPEELTCHQFCQYNWTGDTIIEFWRSFKPHDSEPFDYRISIWFKLPNMELIAPYLFLQRGFYRLDVPKTIDDILQLLQLLGDPETSITTIV